MHFVRDFRGSLFPLLPLGVKRTLMSAVLTRA